MKQDWQDFLSSKLHMILLGGTLAVFVALNFLWPLPADPELVPASGLQPASTIPAFLGAVTFYILGLALVWRSGLAARAVVKLRDKRRRAQAGQILEQGRALMDRLRFLRLPEGQLAESRDFFVQIADQYLAACRREGSWSPRGHYYLEQALTLIQMAQEGRDRESREKRYDAEGQPESDDKSLEALQLGAAQALKGRARELEDHYRDYFSRPEVREQWENWKAGEDL